MYDCSDILIRKYKASHRCRGLLLLVTVVWERDSVGVVFLFWFGLVNTLSPQGKLKSSAAQTTIIREGEKGNPIVAC
jgi:hypothetical protein